MKGIKLRRIITTVIIIAICIYVIPIIASMMFKSSFRDLYVGIEKEISEDIGVVEAKVSKSEGYIYLRKKKQGKNQTSFLFFDSYKIAYFVNCKRFLTFI